ncbi:thioredoxin family protein [Porticoccaceae bacterium LTM1]|nr:thioredoxin family protein [Porticoccaceae bacterium LTM1]
MALTPSTMLPLGTVAPEFTLPEPKSGQSNSLQQLAGEKGTLVMFICNHCPFVKHIESALIKFGKDYKQSGIGIVAINSNDADNYPDDSPERMAEKNYPFPYLYDESQQVAKDYNAACTPDFFLFDRDLKLVYRGQFDDSRPGNSEPVTGADLRAAMDSILVGKNVNEIQHPSIGCNIKWR